MGLTLDETAITCAFAQPDSDGAFHGHFAEYLNKLGTRRASVVLAFPPKAAGTFFRSAAVAAIGGQVMRVTHALGGRDGQPYLPFFVGYFTGMYGDKPLVTHVHMLALPANCRLMEALGLKPIVAIRPILDMLSSYSDMLDKDDEPLKGGLNCRFPADFRSLARARKADLLVDILGPWYVNYFATWLPYAEREPDRVCVLDYDTIAKEPALALEAALSHAGLPRPRAICEEAVRQAWELRYDLRFNRGERGRGRDYFGAEHEERLARMISYYPELDRFAAQLLA